MGLDLPRAIFRVPLSRIGIKPGRRQIDLAHVANLQVSFEQIGQRMPIELELVDAEDPQRDRYTYWLNAGGHRFAAATGLGWADMDAILNDDDAHTAKIAEVDENLIRRGYTALEEAQAIHTRLEAWSARYPERVAEDADGQVRAKRGRPKKLPHGAAISASTMGFADETAKAAGLSKDTVERALAVFRGIPAGVQAQLAGTPIASNSGALRQLAMIGGGEELEKVVAALLDGRAKTVSDARSIAQGKVPIATPTGKGDRLAEFEALCRRMTAAERKSAVEWMRTLYPSAFVEEALSDG